MNALHEKLMRIEPGAFKLVDSLLNEIGTYLSVSCTDQLEGAFMENVLLGKLLLPSHWKHTS